jgi:hypothetical protein
MRDPTNGKLANFVNLLAHDGMLGRVPFAGPTARALKVNALAGTGEIMRG